MEHTMQNVLGLSLTQMFSWDRDGTRSNVYKLKEGKYRLDIRKSFCEEGKTPEQLVQGSDGCLKPGSDPSQAG